MGWQSNMPEVDELFHDGEINELFMDFAAKYV